MLADIKGNQRKLTMTKRKWTMDELSEIDSQICSEKIRELIRDGWFAERYELVPEKPGRYKRVLKLGERGRHWHGPFKRVSLSVHELVDLEIPTSMEVEKMVKDGLLVVHDELDRESVRYEKVLELTELGRVEHYELDQESVRYNKVHELTELGRRQLEFREIGPGLSRLCFRTN
jgi:ribosomal protein L19E